jgi:predicted SAM-dependent methyltransferase
MPQPPSAPTILNLGSGTKTSPATVNIDWSVYLRLQRSRIGRAFADLWLRSYRREHFNSIAGAIVVHDLRKGIPAADDSADAVYHSHVLEHVDRAEVPGFMAEVLRVLKPRGLHRIVVPNFERHVRDYLASLDSGAPNHDDTFVPLLEWSVLREARGTQAQPPFRRRVENLVLGDARKRGQTHQWGYDRLNLAQVLEANGFVDVQQVDVNVSAIPGWVEIGLDIEPDGSPHKRGSLYMEARKPE